MTNIHALLRDAMQPVQQILKVAHQGGVDPQVTEMVHLRVSQINGCSACIDFGIKTARKAGVSQDQLSLLAAWREAPYYTDEQRAALALAEAATRLADTADPVPDSVWNEAARHFDEKGLATLVLMIATTNMFNRLNATTKQIAGALG